MSPSKQSVAQAALVASGLVAIIVGCSSSENSVPTRVGSLAARHATVEHYIYVTDSKSNELLVYPEGVPSATPLNVISVPARPHGVVTDASGNVYVASSESKEISVYSSQAASLSLKYTITNGLSNPQGLALDFYGDLFAANPSTDTILEYGPGQQTVKASFGTPSNDGQQPVGGLATDGAGNLYVEMGDGTLEKCVPGSPYCATINGVVAPEMFGGLAFVPGYLAVCGGSEINYYTFPGLMLSSEASYYQPQTESRFMTSDPSGTLYIPFADTDIIGGPPSAVVVVPSGGLVPYTITAGLTAPYGAAAGP
jgi:hypothetical protein